MGTIPFGKKKCIDGQLRVHYGGYWVKAYAAPADTLAAKKQLIEALTRRLFNHAEHGINVPAGRLPEARRAYEGETEPARKRVKGAMLAGALFNRATELVTELVELQACGVAVGCDDARMQACGEHLQEAMTLGRMVLHRSGEEGLDELWGEPFKAFSFPVEDFYNSRYIKISQAMQAIDAVRDALLATFADLPTFAGVEPLVRAFTEAAKVKSETLRTDPEIFDVNASFVVAGERLAAFEARLGDEIPRADPQRASQGLALLASAQNVVTYITRARVPMPKTQSELLEKLDEHRRLCVAEEARSVA